MAVKTMERPIERQVLPHSIIVIICLLSPSELKLASFKKINQTRFVQQLRD